MAGEFDFHEFAKNADAQLYVLSNSEEAQNYEHRQMRRRERRGLRPHAYKPYVCRFTVPVRPHMQIEIHRGEYGRSSGSEFFTQPHYAVGAGVAICQILRQQRGKDVFNCPIYKAACDLMHKTYACAVFCTDAELEAMLTRYLADPRPEMFRDSNYVSFKRLLPGVFVVANWDAAGKCVSDSVYRYYAVSSYVQLFDLARAPFRVVMADHRTALCRRNEMKALEAWYAKQTPESLAAQTPPWYQPYV